MAWDRSDAYEQYATPSRRFALLTHMLFFVVPSGVAITYVYVVSTLCKQVILSDVWDRLLLVGDVVLSVFLVWLLIYANGRRKQCHEQIRTLYSK